MPDSTNAVSRAKAKTAQRRSAETNVSVWSADTVVQTARPLDKSVEADVCIIGAGIAGLTAGYLLAREGKSVVILEKREIGSGETSHTTAHLSNALDSSFREIERLHGEKGAQLAAQSHAAAIAQIESIVENEGIDCEFERLDGYLFLAEGDSRKTLDDEFEAAQRAGVQVEKLEEVPAGMQIGPCLRFKQQAQFHPLKYLNAVEKAFLAAGGKLFGGTEVTEIKAAKSKKAARSAKVKTKRRAMVTAGAVFVATNTPINDWVKIHTKQAAYRTYAIGMPIETGTISKGLYWDTADPFHYVRSHRVEAEGTAQELLIVGGEDHKTGQDQGRDHEDGEQRFSNLAAWARQHFPGVQEIAYKWSGQVMESMDGLAFIGKNPGDEANVYISTGDSGNGITHGTIAGILIRDLIMERENPWATLYDPSRKTLRAAMTFAKENLNVVAELAQWVTPGEVSSAEEIEPGDGAVIRKGIHKIAVSRDDAGQLHECSAVCPHLGCIVAWNPVERTWDCPCHGSRFDTAGEVLNGPAISPLEQLSASEADHS